LPLYFCFGESGLSSNWERIESCKTALSARAMTHFFRSNWERIESCELEGSLVLSLQLGQQLGKN